MNRALSRRFLYLSQSLCNAHRLGGLIELRLKTAKIPSWGISPDSWRLNGGGKYGQTPLWTDSERSRPSELRKNLGRNNNERTGRAVSACESGSENEVTAELGTSLFSSLIWRSYPLLNGVRDVAKGEANEQPSEISFSKRIRECRSVDWWKFASRRDRAASCPPRSSVKRVPRYRGNFDSCVVHVA